MSHTGGARNRLSQSNSGMVFILAILMIALLTSLVLASRLTKRSRLDTQANLRHTQVRDVAKGGIDEALNWFRRQAIQPVAKIGRAAVDFPYPDSAFKPTHVSVPPQPTDGSLDPSIGLVKEYLLIPEQGIWGRSEVARQKVNWSADATLRDPHAAHDITLSRFPGMPAGSGIVWSVVSRGLIIRRTLPPGNVYISTLAETFAYSEFRHANIQKPPESALLIQDGNNLAGLLEYTTIDGKDTPAVLCFANPGGFPAVATALSLLPTPVEVQAPIPIGVEDLMGLPFADLAKVADQIIDLSNFGYPSVKSNNSLTLIRSQPGYANDVQVNVNDASGILVVDGNVRLSGLFSGLLIVTGNLTVNTFQMKGQAVVHGAIISYVPPIAMAAPTTNVLTFDRDVVRLAINANTGYRAQRASYLKEGFR